MAFILTPVIFVAGSVLLALIMVSVIEMNSSMLEDYMFTGNLDSASSAAELARRLGEVSLNEVALAQFLNTYMRNLGGTIGGSSEVIKLSQSNIQHIKKHTYEGMAEQAKYLTDEQLA